MGNLMRLDFSMARLKWGACYGAKETKAVGYPSFK